MASTEGALNVDRIADEVLDALHGYTRHQEQVTALTSSLNTSATTFTVAEPNLVSRGLVEVGDEQMMVKAVDASTSTVTLQPFGRAVGNTTADSHASGDKLITSPLYTRRRVRDAIYATLREIFPAVFAVGETLLDVTIVRTNYPLPSDCYDVLSVFWHVPGPSQEWAPLRRWRVNRTSTGNEIEALGKLFPGNDRVRVLYIKDLPTSITTDDLSSLGYAQETHDILVLGAVARLLLFTEPSRLQVQSVQSHGRAEVVPAGAIKALAQDAYALFQRRVAVEADRLMQRYATQPHWNR